MGTELEPRAVAEHGLGDALAIDEGAVAAAQIGQPRLRLEQGEGGVPPRDAVVEELQVGVGAAAEDELAAGGELEELPELRAGQDDQVRAPLGRRVAERQGGAGLLGRFGRRHRRHLTSERGPIRRWRRAARRAR